MRIGTEMRTLAWALAVLGTPLAAVAAGGGEKQDKLVHVADTRALHGFSLFVANLYNTDRLLFTLFAVGLTVVMGLGLGLLMDVLVARIGLDLTSRSVKE